MDGPKYKGKDRNLAIILAFFLGVFGVHRFYLGDTKKGVIYLLLSWTGFPLFFAIYDIYKYITNEEEFEDNEVTESIPADSRKEESAATGAEESGAASLIKDKISDSTDKSEKEDLPEGAIMAAEGVNGRVILYEDRLEISREDIGMLHRVTHGFKGDKEIPYDSITSIQLRKPSSMTRGYLQLGQSGFSESDDGLLDATSDENTVLFEKASLSDFEELRSKIRDLKKGDVQESTGTMDGALEKLRERYAEGEIDEEEFKNRKEILEGA